MSALEIVVMIQAAVNVAAIGLAVHIYRRHDKVVRDLMNRLMARDYPEYAASVAAPARQRPPIRYLTDEEAAQREKKQREAARA